LQRLRDEGYDLEIRAGYLLVKHIPYVTGAGSVSYGTFICELTTNGTRTVQPVHEICFIGGLPYDNNGERLDRIMNNPNPMSLAGGLTADCQFSLRPTSGEYADYYDKITMYSNYLSAYAQAIDPMATAKTFPAFEPSEEESVFRYLDAASSRARISAISERLSGTKVAIIGVGGTGSYVLDLIAKTPVAEIHIFDGDRLFAHNAFRSPGAATLEGLKDEPLKVEYYQAIYGAMHRHVFAHPYYIDEANVAELAGMDFVFLALDSGPAKELLVKRLQDFGTSFVEAGMGVYRTPDNKLAGTLRTVTSTKSERGAHSRIPFTSNDDDYDGNIQIADLNALNAALAVLKWKKMSGFYADRNQEHFSAYIIASNKLFNEDNAS
jgi:predicted ThiF/HesA family dinucleotide-utilizing enzyme